MTRTPAPGWTRTDLTPRSTPPSGSPSSAPVLGLVLLAAVALAPAGVGARSGASRVQEQAEEVDVPRARPGDVESVDAIIAAVYDAISGAAGEARDWDRLRSLFRPGGRMIPVGRVPEDPDRRRIAVWTVDQYIEQARPFFEERGFYEREVARTTERYGDIVHAFSTYESRIEPRGQPFQRGINSFQLVYDGDRWWIVTILWQGEGESNPIPSRYLPEPEDGSGEDQEDRRDRGGS